MRDVPDEELPEGRAVAGDLAHGAERVVELQDRPVVDGQQLVELGRLMDRHAQTDHADDHRADEHCHLGGLPGYAVDE